MNELEFLVQFHRDLDHAIILWARMIQALLQADQYNLAFALCDIQPDAQRIDTAV